MVIIDEEIEDLQEEELIEILKTHSKQYNTDLIVNEDGHIISLMIRDEGLEEIPKFVGNLIYLKELDLSNTNSFVRQYNKISRIENLENLTELEILKLGYNAISDIEGLKGLGMLRILDLKHNKIGNIEGLEKFTNLEVLNLQNNPIEDVNKLEELKKILNLKELYY